MKKFLNLVVNDQLEAIEKEIGFSSNIFMIFGLPTRKLKDNPAFWSKKTSLCDLTITRGAKTEIPYGCYARMNQIFIDTEVRTKNTNIIDTGRSFREYSHKVGYKDGRANNALLKQLLNYITCAIKVEPKHSTPGHLVGVQSLVARAWDIYFDVQSPDQLMFTKGRIILDETYAKYIHKHAVPLDMNVIRSFQRNPLALDFYRFLAYRNNQLNKTISFPDHLLFEQLGTEQEEAKITRARLQQILKTLQMYWPVRAKFEDSYFVLEPSPPAVQHKIPSKKPISITAKPETQ